MDSVELLRRYADKQSEEAFTKLVQTNLDLVYSAALRQVGGDSHRAQEVAQSVFTDLARKAATLSRHPSLTGWLYTSTHYAAAKLRRTEQRRHAMETEASQMNELLAAPDSVDWGQLRPILDEAMHDLNARDRDAILLRFFEKRSFAEVGRHLDLGENAARMSVERALDKLGGLLAQRGITSSATALGLALTQQAVSAAPSNLLAIISAGAIAELSAAATGGAIATVLNIMSTTKVMLGLAALGLVGVGAGAYLAITASRANALSASLQRDADALRAQLSDRQRRASVQSVAATRQPSASAALEVQPTSPPSPSVVDPQAQAIAAARTQLLASSDFQQSALRESSATLAKGLELFCRTQNLTLDQTTRFHAVLTGAMADYWRLKVAAADNSVDTKDPVAPELVQQTRAHMENGIRAVLGEAGLRAFLDYELTWSAQDFARQLASRVYFTETPLTAAQAGELTALLARHSPEFRQGKEFNRARVEWENALREAQRILAPRQLAALQGIALEIRYRTQLDAAVKLEAGGKSP